MEQSAQEKEEICIHVVQPRDAMRDIVEEDDNINFRFDVPPFRQVFFRYSMYGQSEVVRSTSLVYASHHSSPTAWLEIRKLSVALVGSNEVPNLALFSPTVNEIYFMGHISYPATAFEMLCQLTSLKNVKFNLGLGGYVSEFHETLEELRIPTPEVPSVTSLEIKINNQLYHSCSEDMRGVFKRMITSVIRHSKDSFRNLESLTVEIPDTSAFLEGVIDLVTSNGNLSRHCEIKVDKEEGKIKVMRRLPTNHNMALPFDPYARFPTFSEYNDLKRVDLMLRY